MYGYSSKITHIELVYVFRTFLLVYASHNAFWINIQYHPKCQEQLEKIQNALQNKKMADISRKMLMPVKSSAVESHRAISIIIIQSRPK